MSMTNDGAREGAEAGFGEEADADEHDDFQIEDDERNATDQNVE